MKVKLSGGRLAIVGVKFGDEQPKLDRPPKVPGPFRSVRINVTVLKDGQEVGKISGVSYCNPADQFDKFDGRKYAMRRILDQDQYDLLSKEDRKILCPVMLRGPEHKDTAMTEEEKRAFISSMTAKRLAEIGKNAPLTEDEKRAFGLK